MNYKKFQKHLNEIINLKITDELIHEAMKLFSNQNTFFIQHTDKLVELLKDAMEDKEGWIDYFIYEMDCKWEKKDAKNPRVEVENKPYPIHNSRQLYNLIKR